MQTWLFYALILPQLTRLSTEQTISEAAKKKLWPGVPFLHGLLPHQWKYRPLGQAKWLGASQVLDGVGWKENLKRQTSAAGDYGRLNLRIKINGRKGRARISSRGALKLSYMDGFLLSQELWKCWKKNLKGMGMVREVSADPELKTHGGSWIYSVEGRVSALVLQGKLACPPDVICLQSRVAYRDDAQFLTFKVLSNAIAQF